MVRTMGLGVVQFAACMGRWLAAKAGSTSLRSFVAMDLTVCRWAFSNVKLKGLG